MNEVSDIREMFETDGYSFEVFKFVEPNKLLCWAKTNKSTSTNWTGSFGNEDVCKLINVEDVDLEVLKAMKCWNFLSPEVKSRVENKIRLIKDNTNELMAKARAGRKKTYENVPSELTCCVCKGTVEAVPSKIVKIVEKKGIMLVDYLANFKCKKCAEPVRRGRAPNPETAKYGKFMKCTCGKEVVLNLSYL
jgi:hypothetical protein